MTWTPERVEKLKEPAWSAEDEARLRELWDKGASAAEISVALSYRHTRNAVIGKVRRMKLPFRRAGQTSRTGKPRIGHFTAEDDALMMRLFAEGRTHQEIAIATGRGRGTVGSRLGFLGCRRLKAKRPTVMKAPPKIKVVSAPAIHTAEELSIGAQRVDQWFFAKCASDRYDLVSGTADPFQKIVWWRFEDGNGDNFRLGYHWQLDEWCYSTTDALDLFPAATTSMTLQDLEDLYGTIGGMPYAVGSRFYHGGIPGLAGFTTDFKLGFFDGPNLEAIIETEDKALAYPRRAITNRITVLVDSDDAEVAIATKETQAGMLSFGSYLSRYPGQPFINSRVSGRWHKFRVRVPAGSEWTTASGMDIGFSDGGGR